MCFVGLNSSMGAIMIIANMLDGAFQSPGTSSFLFLDLAANRRISRVLVLETFVQPCLPAILDHICELRLLRYGSRHKIWRQLTSSFIQSLPIPVQMQIRLWLAKKA